MLNIHSIFNEIKNSVDDDNTRFKIQYLWIYRILGTVSFLMSIVNIFTGKNMLLVSTAAFAVLCLINSLVFRLGEKGMLISRGLFSAEILLLFIFFIISGSPEGFSAIWICLLPSCGLLLFGKKYGTSISMIMLGVLIFFFWLPVGRELLQYNYTQSFMLRFPMLYTAFYAVALFLETIRVMTQEKLIESEAQNKYLYRHDALTGIYNRYGFNECINDLITQTGGKNIALIILDIDFFKRVNDTYGHTAGDIVLADVAKQLFTSVDSLGEVCRWGGEEFAVLMKNGTDAFNTAEKVRTDIENMYIEFEKEKIHVTVSLGAAEACSKEICSCEEIIKCADNCLYAAKESGRNKTVIQKI